MLLLLLLWEGTVGLAVTSDGVDLADSQSAEDP